MSSSAPCTGGPLPRPVGCGATCPQPAVAETASTKSSEENLESGLILPARREFAWGVRRRGQNTVVALLEGAALMRPLAKARPSPDGCQLQNSEQLPT